MTHHPDHRLTPTTMETELSVVYSEAETVIVDTWSSMTDMTPEEARAWASLR